MQALVKFEESEILVQGNLVTAIRLMPTHEAYITGSNYD